MPTIIYLVKVCKKGILISQYLDVDPISTCKLGYIYLLQPPKHFRTSILLTISQQSIYKGVQPNPAVIQTP